MKKIAVHSVPRSGSSWLGSIFDSHPNVAYRFQPLFSYSHKGMLTPASSNFAIEDYFNQILHTSDNFVLQKTAKKDNKVPTFLKNNKTHIIYKEVRYHHILENLLIQEKEIKVIGLIRSPFAVINSWLNAPKEFRIDLDWKIQEEWRYAPKKNMNKPEEFNGYEKWKEVCFLFLRLKKNYPNQFYLISYDDLLTDTTNEIKQLFEFCNLEYKQQTDTFLKDSTSSQSNDAYSVFKKKKNDNGWKKTLPRFIEKTIKEDEDFKKLNKHFKWI
ncbi:MAG: sulfotransferase domain-containing protein [Bacteroidota bacterium]